MDDRTPQDGSTPDEAFDRLRAADPAAGSVPDERRLRARLSAEGVPVAGGLRSVVPSGPSDPSDGSGPSGPDDHDGETAEVRAIGARRRPARWLQVAAAVAGVAVVGGGGYLLGTAQPDGTRDVALLDRDGTSTAEGPAVPQGSPEIGVGRGADGAAGASAGTSTYAAGYGWGRTVFTASGLSDEPTTHEAWAYDAAAVFSADTVSRLAQALGVDGEPRQEWGTWVVGPTDGSGPSVNLMADGLANVSFYDPRIDPWSCTRSAPDTPQGDTGGGADGSAGSAVEPQGLSAEESARAAEQPEVAIAPAPSSCEATGDPAPAGDAAVDRAREVLTSLGLDADGYAYELNDDGGSGALTSVTAYQLVDGERVGPSWYVALTAEGVQSLSGPLAPVVSLGSYDVVSPAEAVTRLGDPRFGGQAGSIDVKPLAEGPASVVGPTDPPTVPATPAAGDALSWPVQDVTITAARLVVQQTTLGDGGTVLAPTYELSDADGSTWTVLAVADGQLDFSPVG